jgi:P27 family predicted phage terminase small subunit
MKGRKPVPSVLKILRGNPGKKRISTREPVPPVSQPKRPEYLEGLAAEAWDVLAPYLVALGVLTKGDAMALEMACQAYARWRTAEGEVATLGAVIKSPNSNYPILNPHLSVANAAQKQLQGLLVEFGLTPSSRSRIKLPLDAGKVEDAFDVLMKGKA